MIDIPQLIEDLIRDEGMVLKAYDDATGKEIKTGDVIKGKITIGVGRNLQGRGITEKEAKDMLFHDIEYFYKQMRKHHTFNTINDCRKRVILNMAFNLGVAGVLSFKKMWLALEREDYVEASHQMLDSKWAEQVGHRATRLAETMRIGE